MTFFSQEDILSPDSKEGVNIMKIILFTLIFFISFLSYGEERVVIAHRGASGYLPEHSLAAYAVAHTMGAHYLEQDIVMTRDGRLIVFHDIYLDRVTNVAEVFPKRKRLNGKYYVIDFTLEEIKSLEMIERVRSSRGSSPQLYPERFPTGNSSFRVSTLEEVIELIQGLNHTTGKDVGIYPEIKAPAYHRRQGVDISLAVLEVLRDYGYTSIDDRIYLQCFDKRELRRIKEELLPSMGMDLKLVQLLRSRDIHVGRKRLQDIAGYAHVVSPPINMSVSKRSRGNRIIVTDFITNAKDAGLLIHPYTHRRETLPPYADTSERFFQVFFDIAQVDGIFTDFPDEAVDFLRDD